MTSVGTTRGFSVDIPEGFIPIPADEATADYQELARQLQALFGLPADDRSATPTAEFFTAFGQLINAGGMEAAAIGFFRSPDEPTRPVSAVLTCARVPSSHESTEVALTGLREIHERQGKESVDDLALPAGSALAVVGENPQLIPVTDEEAPIALLGRTVTAWIPDPSGTTIAVVSISTNSWQDWGHVCDMALEIFDSFTWEEAS